MSTSDTKQMSRQRTAPKRVGLLVVLGLVIVLVWRLSLVFVPIAKPVWVFEGSGDLHNLVQSKDGRILATSIPIYQKGSEKSFVFMVNHDGSENWRYEAIGTLYCEPVESKDGTVYLGDTAGSFYAINPDGSVKWTCSTGYIGNLKPAVSESGTLYAYNNDQELLAISPVGTVSRLFTAGRSRLSKIIIGTQGTVYLSPGDGNLYALEQNGTLKWFEHFGDWVWIAQDAESGRLYAGGGQWLFAYAADE